MKVLSQHNLENEVFREYIYPNGIFRIDNPRELFIGEGLSGYTQRVTTVDGVTYRPTPGWLAIRWVQKDGKSFDF